MSVYCGTDIIEVDRIKDAIINIHGFKENMYTLNEIKDIEESNSDLKYQRYAGRFAAKEAIYKALSEELIENNIDLHLNQIEILNSVSLKRRPKVTFMNDSVQNLINQEKMEIDVSISHIKENAVAMAVVKRSDK